MEKSLKNKGIDLFKGTLLTSDTFAQKEPARDAHPFASPTLIDMEGAAVFHAAKALGVPAAAIKFGSDRVGGQKDGVAALENTLKRLYPKAVTDVLGALFAG